MLDTKRLTSRTAVLCYKTCPRKRYLAFHYGMSGLGPMGQDINLLVGTTIHRGLQHLLEHCRLHNENEQLEEKCINGAVDVALSLWRESLTSNSLNVRSSEECNLIFVIEEHEALIESLIRAFAIYRL